MPAPHIRPLAMLLLTLASLSACSPPPPPQPITRSVLVRTVGADAGAQAQQVYSGEVRARYESELGFRVPGKLTERLVDVGTSVRKGQTLARLDPVDIQLAASAANAQLAAAEADLSLARSELARTEALLARQFVSASALDSRRTTLQAAEARVRQARADAARAANQTDYTRLQADSDGIITAVLAEAGQVMSTGQGVVRLARPGEREVRIAIPESRISALSIGMPAQIRLWMDAERTLTGRIREISPAADSASRTFAVSVSIADGNTVPLGTTATVALASGTTVTQTLPLPAVSKVGDETSVWLVDAQGLVQRTSVTVTAYREDGAMLSPPLPAGSRVVVAGAHTLTEGEPVRAIEEGSQPALDVGR